MAGEAIAVEMNCAVCTKQLEKPRTGRCGHNYCTPCLETVLDLLGKKQYSEELEVSDPQSIGKIIFQCPVKDCQVTQVIPNATVDSFPINDKIRRQIEIQQAKKKKTLCQQHSGKKCKWL